jgi:hypothetical protein
MTALGMIVGRSTYIDYGSQRSFGDNGMTTPVAIVASMFPSTEDAFFTDRLRPALPRDIDLAIGISPDRRHALALAEHDR